MKRAKGTVPCACGHEHAAHTHYRRGSECALCDCPRWRPNRRPRAARTAPDDGTTSQITGIAQEHTSQV